MSEEIGSDRSVPSPKLLYLTQNEVRALRTICDYFRDDGETSAATVFFAVSNDLGRNSKERALMRRAFDEYQGRQTPLLSALDCALKLVAETSSSKDDLMNQKYHFIRMLNEYQRRCMEQGKYLLAKEFDQHEASLKKEEARRQVESVKQKHDRDRKKLVDAHEQQVEEFRDSWDGFMSDFEQRSQEQQSELSRAHQEQLTLLMNVVSSKPKKLSRELLQCRKRQLLMAAQQRYQEAHETKLVSDRLEEEERSKITSSTDTSLKMRQRSLEKQQRSEMEVLAKRIDSKRREYMKKRDEDCARLLQRNKNILSQFDSKHVADCSNLASRIEQRVNELIGSSAR